MQVRKIVAPLLFVCLLATFASAQEAMRISPSTFSPGDEAFLTVYISGLNRDTDYVVATFSGPAGTMTSEAGYIDADQVIFGVPIDITATQGTYTVTVQATRGAETFNFGPATFRVEVPPPPEFPPLFLIMPEAVYAEAVSANGTPVTYSVTSTDGTPVSCSPLALTWFPLGPTTVTCTATNARETAVGEFPVFVLDTTPPVLTVPDDIVSETLVVTWSATATDTIDPNPTVICDPPSGTTFVPGTVTVNCYAYDFHNNYATGSFDVTIPGGAPVLTVPDNINVEATSPAGAVVTFEATATTGGVVVCTPPSGSTFPIGTTTVSCTATNPAGSDTEVFQVRVRDTQAPVIISVNATPNTFWPPDHKMYPVTVNVVAIDAGDASPTSSIISVSSNQPVTGPGGGDGNTSPDWEITGPLTVNLRAERSGNDDRTYTITIQTIDDSGNASTATVEVKVTQQRRRPR